MKNQRALPTRSSTRAWLMVALVSVLWMAGCGGDDAANAIYAPIPTLEAAPSPDDGTAFDVQPVAAVAADETKPPVASQLPDAATVEAFHQQFMEARTAVILGEDSTDALGAIAMPKLVTRAVAAFEENEQLVADESPEARTHIDSFSRVLDVQAVNDDHFAFTSCTEEQSWHLEPGEWSVRFVDELVTIWDSPDGWKLAGIDIRHDGTALAGDLACVPPTFVERSYDGANLGIAELREAFADPEKFDTNGFSNAIGGLVEEEMTQMVAHQVREGFGRVTGQEFTIEVLGLDVTQPNFVVVLSMCSLFPDGVENRDFVTGEVTQVPGYPPGHSETNLVSVWLEPVKWGDARLVAVEPQHGGDDCWETR